MPIKAGSDFQWSDPLGLRAGAESKPANPIAQTATPAPQRQAAAPSAPQVPSSRPKTDPFEMQPLKPEPAKQPSYTPNFDPKITEVIVGAASQNGLDPNMMLRFAKIESSGNPTARSGSYKGLFQMSNEEFAKWGGGSIFDPADNANAAARKIAAESAVFARKYGRPPTATDLYLQHQQGEGGYAAHMSNPQQLAWKNMLSTGEGRRKGEKWARAAIWGNIPNSIKKQYGSVDNVTSADFINIWDKKVNGYVGGSPQIASAYMPTNSAAGPQGGAPAMQPKRSPSGERIVAGADFRPSDPMGLMGGVDNPFGIQPPQQEPQQAVAQPGEDMQRQADALNAQDPGRYELVDESQFDDWRTQWESDQPSEIMKGIKGALVDQNPELLGNAMQALSVITGMPRLGEWGEELESYGGSGAWKRQASVGSVADIRMDSPGNFIGDVTDYASYAMGQAFGSTAVPLATGIAVGAATANPIVGLVAGAAGPSYVQNLGDIYGSLKDDPGIRARIENGELTEQEVAAAATAAAVPMAALDVTGIGKIFGPALGEAKRTLGKRIVKGVIEGTLVEGTTEGLQQVISEAVGDVLGSDKTRSEQAIAVIDNFVAGALSGGAMGGAAGIRSPRGASEPADAGVDEAAVADTAAPEPAPKPGGPLKSAVDYGARQAAQRAQATVPEGAPPVGSNVTVSGDGVTLMGSIDSYDPATGEAIVMDHSTGEVIQVPLSAISSSEGAAVSAAPPSAEVTPEQLADALGVEPDVAESAAPPPATDEDLASMLPPEPPQATETTSEMPPRTEQMPMGERITGRPRPGQRVIVDNPAAGRFPATIESHEDATGETVVRNELGQSFQVGADDLYVSKLITEKQIGDEERKRNPPVDRGITEYPDNSRKIGKTTVTLPDDKHAQLYDFGIERQQMRNVGGASSMQVDEGMSPEQRRLADAFGITPQALGLMADDYRYRAQRAAKGAHTDLPVRMPTFSPKRLTQWQNERAKAEGREITAEQPEAETNWWAGLTADERKRMLDAAAVKRSPKTEWTGFSAPIRAKLEKARAAMSAAGQSPAASIDTAANEAATSPTNELPEPSQAQKEAGNYKVGRVSLGGLDISVENPAGSERSGVDRGGQRWSVKMKSHYGYIRGTVGKDKDHIDTFIKPGVTAIDDAAPVFVVDQRDTGTGQFDEHKVMMGFDDVEAARKAYLENYTAGWGGLAKITPTSMGEFKRWLKEGDTKRPFFDQGGRKADTNQPSADKERDPADTKPNAAKEASEILNGAQVGDTIRVTASGRELQSGSTLTVRKIGDNGSVTLGRPGAMDATWSLAEMRREAREGLAVERAEQPEPQRRPAPKSQVKKPAKNKADIARQAIGASPGDVVTPNVDVGYARAGAPVRIVGIDKNGTVEVENIDGKGRTTWSPAEYLGAKRRGLKLEKVEAPASAADSAPATSIAEIITDIHKELTNRLTPRDFATMLSAGSKNRQEAAVIDPSGKLLLIKATTNPDGDHAELFGRLLEAGALPLTDHGYVRISAYGDNIGATTDGNLSEAAAATLKAVKAAAVREGLTFMDESGPTSPVEAGQPKEQRQFDGNTIFTADKVEAARERLRKKLSQLNSGIDPEVLVDGMTIAGAYIESGVRNFADYARRMTDDFGDGIRPYLLSFWEGARFYPGLDTAGMTDQQESARQHTELNAGAADIAPEANSADNAVTTPENDDVSAELEKSGEGALEGIPADAVPGTGEGGNAGTGADRRGRADVSRDERARGSRDETGRGLSDGEGAVSVPEAGTGRDGRRTADQRRNDDGNEPDYARVSEDGARSVSAGGTTRRAAGPAAGLTAQERPSEYVLSDADELGAGGAKTKFRNNVAAIRLLKTLQDENRIATADEQKTLAKWVGWGGLRNAFFREDGSTAKGWEQEAKALKALLTDEEYRAAESSTRNAHYTSPEIVNALWNIARRLGFAGGQVLEPSIGAGNFIGLMPGDMRKDAHVTGVELDNITGGIAKNLYPQSNIQAPVGFQDFATPDGYFDLVIGNPPFGSEKLYDKGRPDLKNLSIHNFFFAKSVAALKPNGVLAMVVTNSFMDAANSKARSMIAAQADLLGAIRLPNNAFLANAGTEVTTDLVILRKRADGEQPGNVSWTEVKDWTGADGKTVPLNEYFVANPDMMLGDFGAYGSMYRGDAPALVARDGEDMGQALNKAMRALPENIMSPPGAAPVIETVEPATDAETALVGSAFLASDGRIMVRQPGKLGQMQAEPMKFASDKERDRAAGMIRVRDAFTRLRAAQMDEQASDQKISNLRARLNKLYDAFVKSHGPVNAPANKRIMREDPTWPQISALEDSFDKGLSPAVARKTGEKARKPSAQKAAIFTKRTQHPYRKPETAGSAKDALAITLAERGRVDLPTMARLYGKPETEIVKELGPLVFRQPDGSYATADDYLSGNVRKKLAEAERAAEDDPEFRRNIAALREVLPADVEPVDIDVKAGAPWVPVDHVQQFLDHMADGKGGKAYYSRANAKWVLDPPRASDAASTQWSTNRVSIGRVLDSALNAQPITVTDRMSDGTSVVNQAETDAANEKVERVKDEWRRWIWEDDTRRKELARLYNDTFNTDVLRVYDGSHLAFPGKVGDDIISLRPHQKNAVWRFLQSSTTLFDHTVGAGKTFAAIASVMEARRIGKVKKPMLVVPNHLVGQWAADFIRLYPGAKVLAATKRDFEAQNRKRLFARIATGDWDAVIVAHSSFGRIGVDPDYEAKFIAKQVQDLEQSIKELRSATGEKSRNVAQLSKWRDNLTEKLKRLQNAGKKDAGLTFNDLGVDMIAVDEAQEFKNLQFSTSMQRVAGLGNPQGSQKAADLYMKEQMILEQTGGNILHLTGTPLSNTMAEMYTNQRYLDSKALEALGLSHFDAWARVFGEVVTDWELSPSGQYKLNARFAKFVNMPELMKRYLSFADVITNDDIKAQLAAIGKKLPLPRVKGGKPRNIVVERTADQAAFVGEPIVDDTGFERYPEGSLVYRAEHLPKRPEKGADNMLKIMSDARKAALDMRLIDPAYGDDPGSKVNRAADEIRRIHKTWTAKRGTQLVFIDLSTPKKARTREEARIRELLAKADAGDEAAAAQLDKMSPDEFMALDSAFSVYDDLKEKLIRRGVPEKEIAFIHDANTEAQKEEMFGKVRSGQVRVLLGSTAKMGAGTNVQNRLVGLHHLDAPWRPSDLEQRDGRGIRQGNELYAEDPDGFEIEILRYATKKTLDARQWQTIEAKARFIEQVRKGVTAEREIEDISGEAANAAEMKAAASGNPLILEEMDLRQKIRRLDGQRTEHERGQHRVRARLAEMRDEMALIERRSVGERADAERASAASGDGFSATVDGAAIDKPKEFGAAVLAVARTMRDENSVERSIGTFSGFPLSLENEYSRRFILTLQGDQQHQVTIQDIDETDAVGFARRVMNTVKTIQVQPERSAERVAEIERQIPALEKQIGPWAKSDELKAAQARHREVIAELQPKKPQEQASAENVRASIGKEPVARVRGDELNVQFGGREDMPALRKAAMRWYQQNLRGTTATMADGSTVRFTRRGQGKVTSDQKGDMLLRSVPAIKDIIERGTVVLREPGKRAGILERIVIAAPVAFDGRTIHLAVSVHRVADGQYQYDLTFDRDAGARESVGRDAGDSEPQLGRGGLASDGPLPSLEMPHASPAGINLMQIDTSDKFGADSVARVHREVMTGPAGAFIASAIASGRIKIGTAATLDTGASLAQAWTEADGTINLASDRIAPGQANAVLLHEAFHSGRDALMQTPAWSRLMRELSRLDRQLRAGGAVGNRIVENAARRVARAEQLDAPMPDALRAEELGAYMVEEYQSMPAGPRGWVDNLTGRIKAWLLKTFGTQVGRVTPAQLRNIAVMALRDTNAGGSPRGLRRSSIADTRWAERQPLTENRIIEEVKGRLTDLKPAVLATIPLNYFTELARPNMTAVGDYLRVKRQLDAYRGRKHEEADKIAGDWLKFSSLGIGKDGKARATQLADLMHDATLAGDDPSNADADPALRKRFMALPPKGRALFEKVRDAYKQQADELDQILLDNIRKSQEIAMQRAERAYNREIERIKRAKLSPSERKKALEEAENAYKGQRTRATWSAKARLTKMRAAFEASRVQEPYFPLARFGRYFVTVRDVDGSVLSFSRRERAADRDRLAKDMRRAYPNREVEVGVLENANDLRGAMDPRIVAEIETIVGGAGIDPTTMSSVLDQIWQRYLETMPDLSTRKRFIHRKGMAGFDADALRAFSSHMFHAAHQMGRLKYGLELQELTNVAGEQARTSDNPTAGVTLANELRNRHKWVMNPTGSSIAQTATSAAFVYFLAGSPAAALVNMTQTPMIGIPVLGARFGGLTKAAAAIAKASADSVVGKGSVSNANLTDAERRAMKAFGESGLIDRTRSHDLAGVGETGVNYSPVRARVMAGLSILFHRAEVWNREVTALAAYRLARKSGQREDDAINTAHDLTWKTHFDYSNASRPRVMQNDVAKIALVFRSYSINMLYRMMRDAHQMFAGETPQARKEARYQLAGITGMMALMSGVSGVFGFNLMMGIASLFFGDDDDPMDFKTQFRRDMLHILGPELGGVVLDGVPGHYLGIDLTERIGMPDIWFRSPYKELEGEEEYQYWVFQILGASVGIGGNLFRGSQYIADGNIRRGIETMVPKFIRDPMKAWRHGTEGVTTIRGDQILDREAITFWDDIAQVIGFTPARVAETYDRNSALKGAEQRILDERRELVNRFALAHRLGDMERRAEAMEKIKAWNRVPMHRPLAITGETLKSSLRVRQRNAKKREDGVLIQNRRLGRDLRERLPNPVYR